MGIAGPLCHAGSQVRRTREMKSMLVITLVMVFVLVAAAAVVVYVAYPHRGEDVPVVPQLGDAMRKGVDALPTIGEFEDIRA